MIFTLPNEWQEIALGDYVEVVRGASPRPKGDPKYFGGKINWISIKDVNAEKGKYLSITPEFVTEAGAEKSRLLPIGSLILSNSASVCIPKILKKEGCIHDGFVTFPNINANFHVDYFYHLFNWMRPTVIQENKQGVTQVNLNTDIIRNFQLPIPPLAEQKAIADKLDALLAQVETTKARFERIRDILKRFRQSVLAAAVSGRLTEEFLQRSTGVFPLKDICVEDRPITYGVIKLGNEDHSGVPCLRTSNIRWLNIETDEVKKISKDISNDYSRTILRGNEVLVNVRGTLGGVSTISNSMIGWNVSREVAVVAVDSLKATDKYIAYVIASDETQRWLKDAQKGVAYVGINLEDLRKLPIRVPTIEEQTEIVHRVEQLFAFADTIEQKASTALERVNNLTQSILAKAFRGELTAEWRAANPDLISGENSAEALLERIKAEREAANSKPNKRNAKA